MTAPRYRRTPNLELKFGAPSRRRFAEPVVPMINVVFLLLIFFLMTAYIAPPDPFEMQLPATPGGQDSAPLPGLYLSQTGELAYGTTGGKQAIAAAVDAGPIQIHAHAHAPASALARLLADLSALGADEVSLITIEATQ